MIKIINNTIVIRVEGRDICLAAGELPTSGSRGCDSVMFLFSGDEWDGLEKSVVFWQNENERYELPMGRFDTCEVPFEALSEDGYLNLGLIGRSGERLQNSKVLTLPLLNGVREGNMLRASERGGAA